MKKRVLGQRGIALVMVLWLLVLLVVMASQFALSARTGLETVKNLKEDREAYFLAYAGIQMAMREIMAESQYHHYDEAGELRFAKVLYEGGYSPRSGIPLGEGLVSYSVRDEGAKLNLNRLAADEGQLRLLLLILFPDGLAGIDTAVDSIMDWVDPDDAHRANGAESDYYEQLNPPYKAKNREFDTVDELKKVSGVTQEIYSALSRTVTVYPTKDVNLNTAPFEVLIASGMAEDEVERILDARESDGYYSDSSKSNLFEIEATGRFGESRLSHSIKVVVSQVEQRKLIVLDWVDNFY